MTVGEYIKHLRTQRGMTQEELGEKIGVKKAAVQKWESGLVQNLKRTTIKQLADIFNVNPANFVGENGESAPSEDEALNAEIVKLYGSLTPEKQAQALDYLRFLKEQGGKK